MSYLSLHVSDCRNCYKCIRHCPVQSINFSDGQANIMEDECILCGTCYIICPQHAKTIRKDTDRVREWMKTHRVVASLAPSFIAKFPIRIATPCTKHWQN